MSGPGEQLDPVDPLGPFRNRWRIEGHRYGLHLVSAELQPTQHSLIYVVAHSAEVLAQRLAEIEHGLQAGGKS